MKKIIRKISAIAMAFTILGAGSVITEAINPQTNNTITVSAAPAHTCGQFVERHDNYVKVNRTLYYAEYKFLIGWVYIPYTETVYENRPYYTCRVCGARV